MPRFGSLAGGIAVLLGAACISACAGMTRPSVAIAPASTVDACALYTLTDAQKILGANAKPGTPGKLGPPSQQYTTSACSYTSSSGSGSPSFVSTTVLVRRASDPTQGKRDFVSARNKIPRSQEVAGVGEAAYWNPSTGQLSVWKGRDWVIISAGRAGPRNLDIARQVAYAILQRD